MQNMFNSIYNKAESDLRNIERESLIRAVSTAIKEIEDMHPYKESGNRESYSKYNEGWSDACDLMEYKIIQILKA